MIIMKNKFLSNPLFILAIEIGILIIAQILFKIPAPCKWLEAVWSAGDFITFCGTVGLGVVTCTQTQKANEMSQRLMEIEENRDRLEVSPFFMVTKLRMDYMTTTQNMSDEKRILIEIGK